MLVIRNKCKLHMLFNADDFKLSKCAAYQQSEEINSYSDGNI